MRGSRGGGTDVLGGWGNDVVLLSECDAMINPNRITANAVNESPTAIHTRPRL